MPVNVIFFSRALSRHLHLTLHPIAFIYLNYPPLALNGLELLKQLMQTSNY